MLLKMRRNFRWWFDDQGQALLESALVLPILIFLLFALFTVGYWMNAQQIITQAARQGARQGALTNDNTQIMGAVTANTDSLDPSGTKVGVTITPASQNDVRRMRGNPLTVYVTYPLPFAFAGLPDRYQFVSAKVVTMMECVPPPGQRVCR